MTAPALIALAHGSRDPRSARTVREVVALTRQMRPDLRIEPAFLDHSRPDLDTVVDRLVARGHREIVVVPMLLTAAYHARIDVPETVAASAARHEGIAIRAADVLGTDAPLLTVLDEHGMGSIGFTPLAQGLLTSKYLGDEPADRSGERGSFTDDVVTPDMVERLRYERRGENNWVEVRIRQSDDDHAMSPSVAENEGE